MKFKIHNKQQNVVCNKLSADSVQYILFCLKFSPKHVNHILHAKYVPQLMRPCDGCWSTTWLHKEAHK